MNFTKTIVNAMMTWVNKRLKENTPNWNQNDSNADGYIRNRPFYTEVKEVEVLAETTLDFSTADSVDWGQAKAGYILEGFDNLQLNVGQTYYIEFDGVEYETVAFIDSAYNNVVVGNGAFVADNNTDNGLPFAFGNYAEGDSYIYAIVSHQVPYTISIATISEVVHKIDPKYMPITGTEGQFVVIGSDGNMTTKTIANAEEASF